MVGKQTIVFSGGEIVPGYEPKFWRFEESQFGSWAL